MTSDRRDWPKVCREWWAGLQRINPDTKQPNPRADTGALARLRRASTPVEAAQEQQTIALYRKLQGPEFNERKLESIAVIAAVLAHIRSEPESNSATHIKSPTAAALGQGDAPAMSPLRLRRLTAAQDAPEVLRTFRETVSLLRGKADVADVAISIIDWLDEYRADRRKTFWIYDYHSAGFAPDQGNTPA